LPAAIDDFPDSATDCEQIMASTTPESRLVSPPSPVPNPHRLPTPDDRPSADVVIYDGHCRICTAQIKKLMWWDCQGKLSYLSLHDPEVARRYPDLRHDQLMQEMVIVDRHGKRHPGAEAIRYLSRRLRWLAPILHVPLSLPLWRWLYRQVAKRRYKFGKTMDCDGGTCHLHQR
jgi:predicted DCC family thiol-disulfide oxidoreductase YuxK